MNSMNNHFHVNLLKNLLIIDYIIKLYFKQLYLSFKTSYLNLQLFQIFFIYTCLVVYNQVKSLNLAV